MVLLTIFSSLNNSEKNNMNMMHVDFVIVYLDVGKNGVLMNNNGNF